MRLDVSTETKITRWQKGRKRTACVLPPGYRVIIRAPKPLFLWASTHDVCFTRLQDAQRAKAALEQAGLVTFQALMKAGPEKVRQIMLEAMAW